MNRKESRQLSESEILVNQFLQRATEFQANVEPIKVLKSRTYKIAESNVLVRAASEGNRRYFFGLNYLTVEEMANIDNPFIAFICGFVERTIFVPAKLLFKYLPQISHDRNGEFKINIDLDLNIVLIGKNNRLKCSEYVNAWSLLLSPPNIIEEKSSVEDSLHSILQGRLIEIGNIRGFQTYCPDKSKTFNDRKLEDLSTIKTCPQLQFSDYNLLRKIDVLWFRSRGELYIPEYAFEVELSTGIWSGVGRMATLYDYTNVSFYVISNDEKRFRQVLGSFSDIRHRFKYINYEVLGELYSAEINLKELRVQIGL